MVGDILKTRFLIRNLPMGIACQFKVSGYNNAGWGEFSDHTSYVVPGICIMYYYLSICIYCMLLFCFIIINIHNIYYYH